MEGMEGDRFPPTGRTGSGTVRLPNFVTRPSAGCGAAKKPMATSTETRQVPVPAELTEINEERQVVVHCTVRREGGFADTLIRIWPTTFLVQQDGSRKKMMYFDKISPFPIWMPVRLPHTFTLVFEGLDDDCGIFDLFEEIPQSGGFHVRDIRRNGTDVYHVDL